MIGRISVTGRAERENLPNLYASGGNEVGKPIGLRTKVANAERTGERGRVKKDAARTWEGHRSKIADAEHPFRSGE